MEMWLTDVEYNEAKSQNALAWQNSQPVKKEAEAETPETVCSSLSGSCTY